VELDRDVAALLPGVRVAHPLQRRLCRVRRKAATDDEYFECDDGDLRCDLPVEVMFEDVTDEITLPKFRPVQNT
jgi:hypothetical protein